MKKQIKNFYLVKIIKSQLILFTTKRLQNAKCYKPFFPRQFFKNFILQPFFGYLFILFFSCLPVFCSLKYSTTSYILFPQVVNCGGVTKSSSSLSSYNLTQTIGQSVVGISQTVNKKNIFGFLSYFIKIILGKMSFYDEEPLSNVFQPTTNVVCKITLESYSAAAISTSTIKYRISTKGSSEENFTSWRDDAQVETIFSSKKVRFKVVLPNRYNDNFLEGENNYIQWYCEDRAHNKITSAKYKIKILENDAPEITIFQPKNNDIVSTNLVIEAKVTDERWGVNPSSITLTIENSNNEKVWQLESSVNTQIWNPETQKIYYYFSQNSQNNILVDGQRYKLTITVYDKNNKGSTKSTMFLVKNGQLADVIPYPSPCDPTKQPVSIRYVLSEESEVTINIYDQSGTLIKNLVEKQNRLPGVQEENWFGDNFAGLSLANGIYFCEIVVKNTKGQYRHYTPLAIFRR